MTTEKVTLAYITDESQRKVAFNKGKNDMIKEVSELSSLCGVEAYAIICNANEPEPEVWPSQVTAQTVLERFHMSQVDQTQKVVDEESLIAKENKKKELKTFMFKCMAGLASLSDFDWRDKADMDLVIKETEQEINSRLKLVQCVGGQHHSVSFSNDAVKVEATRDVPQNGSSSNSLNSTNITQSLN